MEKNLSLKNTVLINSGIPVVFIIEEKKDTTERVVCTFYSKQEVEKVIIILHMFHLINDEKKLEWQMKSKTMYLKKNSSSSEEKNFSENICWLLDDLFTKINPELPDDILEHIKIFNIKNIERLVESQRKKYQRQK